MNERRVSIITGASRGIGKETAMGLVRQGFNIVLVARSRDMLLNVAKEIKQLNSGVEVLVLNADVSDPKSVQDAVKATYKKYSRIDLLVNNAGIGFPGTFEVSLKTFNQFLKVNLLGPFVFMQEVVPIMLEQGRGHIINLASRNGKIGFAGWGAYSASKFGLVGLSESVYRELAMKGIKVTTICPSWVNTDMAREGGATLSPLEMIQPADICKTILWLLELSPAVAIREVTIECREAIQ